MDDLAARIAGAPKSLGGFDDAGFGAAFDRFGEARRISSAGRKADKLRSAVARLKPVTG